MDLNYLRRLVKIFDDSKATHLEIEEDGVLIALSVESATIQQMQAPAVTIPYQNLNNQYVNDQPKIVNLPNSESKPEEQATKNTDKLHTITSPIVGTFYRSPSPDAGSFVEIGTKVKAGDTLCIIEAMKLMNEIESDVSGTIVKILVENTKPVEFNQPIFVVRPD
jgi:acetyl-CoA carboxylase biotin carboxyl carrier protein